jgi:hypothetical protein
MNGERRPINWSAFAVIPIAIAVVTIIFSAGARISRLESNVERLAGLGTDARVVKLEAQVDEQSRSLVRMYDRLIEIERRTRNGSHAQ